MVTGVLAADTLQLPHLDYAAMAPMLILFGAACVGVLVEALVPRSARYGVQIALSLLSLGAALFAIAWLAKHDKRTVTAPGELAIDGPTLFMQGTLVVLGILALLLVGERTLERGGPFVAQAAITVGSEADRRQAAREPGGTEVFPLALFALFGMMLFVASNDLLIMFVA